MQELSNDWCLLLLGDKFKLTPENTLSQSGKSVVHLTLNHKKNLGYKSLANAQMNSKNIGYLYAIHHGAKIIFDTEICNDISLSEEVSTAITSPLANVSSKLAFVRAPVWNPYPYFCNRTDVWPRGFPLQWASKPACMTMSIHSSSAETTLGLCGFNLWMKVFLI